MEYNPLGKNIRFYRLQQKLTQADLAEKTGLSTTYIGIIERGGRFPSLETFITIINALNVSADVVLADLLKNSYKIRTSRCLDQLEAMCATDRITASKLLDALVDAYHVFHFSAKNLKLH